jgi:dimethylargininase
MPIAYTRAPSANLNNCQLTHVDRVPIDAARAAAQHAAYEAALTAAGCRVVRLPPLPDAPDGVFVEDTALLLGETAVITRPGNAMRADETDSVARALAADFRVIRLTAGRLDGGDVLRVDNTLFAGLSTRTDRAGIGALTAVVGALGLSVVPVPVAGSLHLKTAVTWLGPAADGRGWLLANPAWVDPAAFDGINYLPVAPGDDWAANTLRLGGTVLVAAGAPRTAARLRARGYHVVSLDISELQKAEAGLTCLSLIHAVPAGSTHDQGLKG